MLADYKGSRLFSVAEFVRIQCNPEFSRIQRLHGYKWQESFRMRSMLAVKALPRFFKPIYHYASERAKRTYVGV